MISTMTRKPPLGRVAWNPSLTNSIQLTPSKNAGSKVQVRMSVETRSLLAYSQCEGYTRLTLTGGKILDVLETTAQIDRLVAAASTCSPPIPTGPSQQVAG